MDEPDRLSGGLVNLLRAVIYFFATWLIHIGVTLLGWGLDDLMGYFSLSPRLWSAVVVGLFSLAVGIQAYGSVEGILCRVMALSVSISCVFRSDYLSQ
jgi:hypothetical protein